MSVTILRANALALPLADSSVDLVVTSPPYFGLRSYQDGGEHYEGQIGAEATPTEFVDALIAATREMARVLKPSGSIWVNLGDKYVSDNRGSASDVKRGEAKWAPAGPAGYPGEGIMPRKSLMGIPWRYAIRCIDELGLILRAEVIWSKPNGLPESVTDRVRRSHEQWFCFEKDESGGVEAGPQGFPFCPLCGRPVDARATLIRRLKECHGGSQSVDVADQERTDELVQQDRVRADDGDVQVGLGGPLVPELVIPDATAVEDGVDFFEDGGVAVVDADAEVGRPVAPVTQGDCALSVDDSGKPAEVCECDGHPLIIDDEPWLPQSLAAEIMQRVADGEIDPQQAADFLSGDYVRNHSVWFHFTKEPRYYSAVDEIREPHKSEPGREGKGALGGQKSLRPVGLNSGSYNTLGALPGSVWTIPTEPLRVPESLGIDHFAAFPTEWPRRIIQGWSPEGGVVLDPFGGTGTTALVADALGRHGITVDLSADYCRLAEWRTTDPGQRAKAARVEAVEPVPDGQLSLFEESA